MFVMLFEYACHEGIAIFYGLQFTLCVHVPMYTYIFLHAFISLLTTWMTLLMCKGSFLPMASTNLTTVPSNVLA
jgi:hypothetical protein